MADGRTLGKRDRRRYNSPTRSAQARRTRERIILAATEQFVTAGFTATTMRAVAAAAATSVPTIELMFGTKRRLLQAAIDVAIAGDDEPVPVLRRAWARGAEATGDVASFLEIVTAALAAAQERSSGLILAAAEAARHDPELDALSHRLDAQRLATATWIVGRLAERRPLRPDTDISQAVDTTWLMMDPFVYRRATRDRGWSTDRYRQWFTVALQRLLLTPPQPASVVRPRRGRRCSSP